MLFWFSVRAATSSVAHALHTFGGYGLSNEYDIQLYHRRAKTWGLLLGDPLQELSRAGRRLFLGEKAVLPDPGIVDRSEEHTSELQSLMRNSYAVFCLQKKKKSVH